MTAACRAAASAAAFPWDGTARIAGHLQQRGHIGMHHRHPGRHRFQHGQPEPLGEARRGERGRPMQHHGELVVTEPAELPHPARGESAPAQRQQR